MTTDPTWTVDEHGLYAVALLAPHVRAALRYRGRTAWRVLITRDNDPAPPHVLLDTDRGSVHLRPRSLDRAKALALTFFRQHVPEGRDE